MIGNYIISRTFYFVVVVKCSPVDLASFIQPTFFNMDQDSIRRIQINFNLQLLLFVIKTSRLFFLYRSASVDYNMARGLPKWDFLGKIWQIGHYWELYFLCNYSDSCVYQNEDLCAYKTQTAWRQSNPIVRI